MTQQAASRANAEASPLSALRRRWWIALLLCPLGAAAGAAASSLGPTTYTAATTLAVGSPGLNNQPTPDQGDQAEGMADQYARWVNNRSAGDDSGVEIEAKTLADRPILEISAGAGSQAAAVRAANTMAQDLIKAVNASRPGNDPDAVLKQYQAAAQKANALKTEVDAANTRYQVSVGRNESAARQSAARKALTDLESQEALLAIQRDALADKYRSLTIRENSALDISVVTPATETNDDRNAKLQRYGMLGFLLGGLLSLFLAMRLDKNERRKAASSVPAAPRRRPAPPEVSNEPWAARAARPGQRPPGGPMPRPSSSRPTRPSGSR